ncbi:MAG: GIY-YIG nuclease family protein [Bacteroidetes bacterium]|nr:GIY-YIG nuclease family protein [Bacteroidota bacterium]
MNLDNMPDVYIIQSENDKSYYKGYAENPKVRLSFHIGELSS